MLGILPFVFTVSAYFALLVFNLQSFNTSGDRAMSLGFLVFALILSYVVFSLILTITVATNGGFNWISNNSFSRNIGVALIWLGMIVGVAFCLIFRMEFRSGVQTSGLEKIVSLPIYFGSVWLPLLMLIPYAIFLNPAWRDSLSPNLFKIPLILGSILGVLIAAAPNILASFDSDKYKTKMSEAEYAFNQSMDIIGKESSIRGILSYTQDGQDARLRKAAMVKIKEHKDLEGELSFALDDSDFIDSDDQVYQFLKSNKINYPERLVAAINRSIFRWAIKIQNIIQDPAIEVGYLEYLDVELLCRVLDMHFTDSIKVFRPNMQKLQEVLEISHPNRRSRDTLMFDAALDKYRMTIKNWLKTHK